MKIKDEILDILGNCRIKDNAVFLPEGQLDRKTYLAVNQCLENIGGKWNRKSKGHIFEDDPTEMLDNLINTGETENFKKTFQFYETPELLAKEMVKWAEIDENDKILEPSAGLGAIAKFLPQNQLTCVEIDPVKVGKLDNLSFEMTGIKLETVKSSSFDYGMGFELIGMDFLQYKPNFFYNKIVMNPPFSLVGDRQADISHILHAWDLLADNGILVAVISFGAYFRSNKKSVEFREWMQANHAMVKDIPEGTFKASGTMVRAKLIKVIKC